MTIQNVSWSVSWSFPGYPKSVTIKNVSWSYSWSCPKNLKPATIQNKMIPSTKIVLRGNSFCNTSRLIPIIIHAEAYRGKMNNKILRNGYLIAVTNNKK